MSQPNQEDANVKEPSESHADGPDRGVSTNNSLSKSDKKLLAFEVAEEAKRQITSWAKWIIGTFVVVAALLGIKTYFDVHTSIREATDKRIGEFKTEAKNALDSLEFEFDQTLRELRKKVVEAEKDVEEAKTAGLVAVKRAVGKTQMSRTVARKEPNRTISPGISVGGVKGGTGTICCIVKDRKDLKYILTAAFIVADSLTHTGNVTIQPGALDGGTTQNAIGSVTRVTKYAALVKLKNDIEAYGDIPEIGPIRGIAAPRLGDTVRMYGRTSGLTEGIVTNPDRTLEMNLAPGFGGRQLIECAQIESLSEITPFSQAGDGGAPVVNANNQLVGMLYGASTKAAFIVPIKPILNELKVKVVTGP